MFCLHMVFSKSFGYALRGVLYVAVASQENRRVQVDEIAKQLAVPKPFLGKIMNRVVKEGMLNSVKGHKGGFFINDKTLKTPLTEIMDVTRENQQFGSCVLHLGKCNAHSPCPMHRQIESLRQQWQTVLMSTTIGDLLSKDQPDFIRSIAAI